MQRTILTALTMVLVGLAGCASDDPEIVPPPPAPPDPCDLGPCESMPYNLTMRMPDCLETGIIFHLPLDRLQEYLPDGYQARPALEQYAALGGAPAPGADLVRRGWFLIDGHGCTLEDGTFAGDIALQIAIRPAERDNGLPPATLTTFEVGRAGNISHFIGLMTALGGTPFGDAVDMTWSDDGDTRSAFGEAFLDGETVLRYTLPSVPENPLPSPPEPHARFWMELPNGTLRAGWDPYVEDEHSAFVFLGGQGAICTLAEGTLAAEIVGVTSCSSAGQSGLLPTPFIQEIHDMDTEWVYTPHAMS